jgi:arabinose-5-phosphate isomerase
VAIMERNSITCLIVTDHDAKPEGVIHLHDLLKAGVV